MSSRQQPLCVVRLGYHDYLLPLAKGTQLMAILAHAVRVEQDFAARDRRWKVDAAPLELSLNAVRADQIDGFNPFGSGPVPINPRET